MKLKKVMKRAAAGILAALLLFTVLPNDLFPMTVEAAAVERAADPSTAMAYTHMLGTENDGNRYAGRIWVDKSVYTGQEAAAADKYTYLLTNDGITGNPLPASLSGDEFMTVYSALGSTTSISTTTTVSQTAPRDVVIVIDTSTSMSQEEGTGANRKSRLSHVVQAADALVKKLDDGENRIGVIAYNRFRSQVAPLDTYTDMSITVTAEGTYGGYQGNTSGSIRVTGKVNGETEIYNHTGEQGTNIQAGIDAGAEMLIDAAEGTSGRVPVLIVLTDGEAYGADNTTWTNPGTVYDDSNRSAVVLTTILNAAYNKVRVQNAYNGVAPLIYTVGVDLENNNLSHAIMDPKNNFNASFNNDEVETAFDTYYNGRNGWLNRTTTMYLNQQGSITDRQNQARWTIVQTETGVTKQQIIDNIGYADEYFNVESGSNDLADAFQEIYESITSGSAAFHPITDTVQIGGAHRETPLTYVDPIGEYMELRNIHAVTLYGKSYSVTKGTSTDTPSQIADGITLHTVKTLYSVGSASDTIKDPVTNTTADLQDSVWLELTESYTTNASGRKTSVSDQELRVLVNEAALPLWKSEVTNVDGNVTYTKDRSADPVRVYYTVGLSKDVLAQADNNLLMANRISSEYLATNQTADGKINFYTNQYGILAPNGTNELLYGDAHASVTPSTENRYYYHKQNFPVYKSVTLNNGVQWDDEEFGVLWYHGNGTNAHYEANKNPDGHTTVMMMLPDVEGKAGTDRVYTFINFYRPTTGTNGEAVTYLAYTTWDQLSADCGFYDTVNEVYINGYDSTTGTFVTSAEYGLPVDVSVAKAYANANNGVNANQIAVCLGLHSWRQSRLDNMKEEKTQNNTDTADLSYAPKYDTEDHHVGDLVVWLGNNGKLTVDPTQGFSLTKRITATTESTDGTFNFEIEFTNVTDAFTVSLRNPDGTAFAGATDKNITTANNVLNVGLKKDQTVYVVGVPMNTTYKITETNPGNFNVVINDTMNTNNDAVYEGAVQNNAFTTVIATNTEKGKGGVYITKEVESTINGASVPTGDKFTVTATITDNTGTDLIVTTSRTDGDGKPIVLSKVENATAGENQYLYAESNGTETITLQLVNGETVLINGLSDGAVVTVAESNTMPTNANGTYARASTNVTDNDTDKQSTTTDGIVNIVEKVNDTVVVHNTYTRDQQVSAKVDLDITKQISKTDMDKLKNVYNFDAYPGTAGAFPQFSFELQQYTTADGGKWETVKTYLCPSIYLGDPYYTGSVPSEDTKDAITRNFTEPGVYAYQVVEKLPTTSNVITYDRTVYTFDVHVTDDGNGGLKVDVHSHNDTDLVTKTNDVYTVHTTFTNSYHTAATYLDIEKSVTAGQLPSNFAIKSYHAKLDTAGVPVETTEGVWTVDGDVAIQTQYTDAQGEARFVRNYNNNDFAEGSDATTYYFIIKEDKAGTTDSGWKYDSKQYQLTVKVTRNAAQEVTAVFDSIEEVVFGDTVTVTPKWDANAEKPTNAKLSFANSYDPTDAEIEISTIPTASKKLVGRELRDTDKFVVEIVNESGNVVATSTGLSINNADPTTAAFTFANNLTFSEVGTYHYKIREKKPVAGDSGYNPAVTYSDVEYDMIITVTDIGGALRATYILENSVTQTAVFENTYNATNAQQVISGMKKLAGEARVLHANEFAFKLEGGNLDAPVYALNSADGSFNFAPITYTQDDMDGELSKPFTYTVTEYIPSAENKLGGISYDGTTFEVQITVTDDGQGKLTAGAPVVTSGGDVTVPTFTNTYDAVLTTPLTISGTKDIIGREVTEGETFNFVLLENGLPVKRATNDASGTFSFTFDGTEFTTANTYHYVLVEEIPADDDKAAGMIYDPTEYEITVEVMDDGNGKLTAAAYGTTDKFVFYNTYDPADVKIVFNGIKELTGRDKALEKDEFKFSMYRTDAEWNITQTEPVWTSSNDENGKFQSIEGVFHRAFDQHYIIVEEPYTELVKDGKYIVNGITYDETVHKVHVVVSDKDAQGNYLADLTATVTIDDVPYQSANGIVSTPAEALTFKNTYKPTGTDIEIGEGTEVDIKASKALTGKVLNAGDYKFKLSEATVSADGKTWTKGKELETAKNTATGGFIFKKLSYDTIGTFHYIVEEVNDGKGGIIYDDTVYYVTVEITDDQEGHLVPTYTIKTNKSETTVNEITFKNSYVIAENDKLKLTGVKKLTGAALEKDQFKFELYKANDKFEKGRKLDTAKNDAEGKIEFTAQKIKEPGTYYYVVTEKEGNEKYVTYDATVWNIKVVAEDNGEGELKLTTTVVVAGSTEDKGVFTFVNKYEEPKPVATATPEPTATPAPTTEPTAEPSEEPSEEPTATATPAPKDNPATGDNSNIMLWLGALAAALVGVAATMFVFISKRNKKSTGRHYR